MTVSNHDKPWLSEQIESLLPHITNICGEHTNAPRPQKHLKENTKAPKAPKIGKAPQKRLKAPMSQKHLKALAKALLEYNIPLECWYALYDLNLP